MSVITVTVLRIPARLKVGPETEYRRAPGGLVHASRSRQPNWDDSDPTNINDTRTVGLFGVADEVHNLVFREVINVTHTAASTDTDYDGIDIPTVVIRLEDQDGASGVTVTESGTPAATEVNESGDGTTDSYTVVLRSKPLSDVKISATSSAPGAAKLKLGSAAAAAGVTLTFKTSDWNQAQTVTVEAVDDRVDNVDDMRSATISHAVTAGDGGRYTSAREIDSVSVTVNDDSKDKAGVSLSPASTNLLIRLTARRCAYKRALSVA